MRCREARGPTGTAEFILTGSTSPGRRGIFWILDHTLNPLTVRLARTGHGPFSLVRHIGRSSGHAYETPVILARVPEGFVAELTFGDRVNWYRNLVAAGGGTVVRGSAEYQIVAIEPCDAATGRSAYPLPFRTILRTLGRRDFRLLRAVRQPGA